MTGNENSENRSLETITASLTYHAGLLTCVTISAWLLYKLARLDWVRLTLERILARTCRRQSPSLSLSLSVSRSDTDCVTVGH